MTAQNLSAAANAENLAARRAERAVASRVPQPTGPSTDASAALDLVAMLPQSTSGVFDQAFDLYKRHSKTLLLIAALLYFPTQIALHAVFNTWLLPIQAHLETPDGSSDVDAVLQLLAGGLLIGIPEYGLPGLCALIVMAATSGPLCVAVSDIYFGRTPSVLEAYRRSLRIMPRLILGWLFAALVVFGVSVGSLIGVFLAVLCVSTLLTLGSLGAVVAANVSSVLLVLGMIATYLCCTAVIARFLLFITPLTVLEGLPLTAAWSRNQQMIGRVRFRRTWAAASALPVVVFGLQSLILLSVYGTINVLDLSPLTQFLLAAACTAAIVLFFQPYLMIFITMLYYDYRVRGEGFDLVLLASASYRAAQAAEEGATTPAPPAEAPPETRPALQGERGMP